MTQPNLQEVLAAQHDREVAEAYGKIATIRERMAERSFAVTELLHELLAAKIRKRILDRIAETKA